MNPLLLSSTFPGAPLQHGFGAGTTTPSQKGHATVFGEYQVGPYDFNAQWTWFSGLDKNGVFGAGQTYYAQNHVPAFQTIDITISRKVNASMDVYFNVRNATNAIPPDLIGSSGNPGGVNTPTGEDLMGQYFTIGVRGSF